MRCDERWVTSVEWTCGCRHPWPRRPDVDATRPHMCCLSPRACVFCMLAPFRLRRRAGATWGELYCGRGC